MPLQSRPDGLKFDPDSGVLFAPRERIIPDPEQPRKSFPKSEINELRRSIDTVREVGRGLGKTGIDMPLLCRWEAGKVGDKKSKLILEDGERRWRATEDGFDFLPIIIKNDSSEEAWDVALRSSLQKKLLTPMEEGNAFAAYMKRTGHGTYRTARHYGVSEGFLKNRVYLRDCPSDVQDMVNRHSDTMSHALAFRAVGKKLPADDRKELIQEVLSGMSLVVLKGEIEARIATHERKADTRRAPDTHTQSRQTQAAVTGSAPVSRGERLKGASLNESLNEAVNGLKTASTQIDNAATWFRTIDEKSYINKVVPEIEKLIAKLEQYKPQ